MGCITTAKSLCIEFNKLVYYFFIIFPQTTWRTWCIIYSITSLTTCEDDISLHLVHSILLTHEQRLYFQNTISPETNFISTIMATTHQQNNNNKRINTRVNFSQNKNSYSQRSGRSPSAFGNRSQGSHNNPTNCL